MDFSVTSLNVENDSSRSYWGWLCCGLVLLLGFLYVCWLYWDTRPRKSYKKFDDEDAPDPKMRSLTSIIGGGGGISEYEIRCAGTDVAFMTEDCMLVIAL